MDIKERLIKDLSQYFKESVAVEIYNMIAEKFSEYNPMVCTCDGGATPCCVMDSGDFVDCNIATDLYKNNRTKYDCKYYKPIFTE